MSALTAEDKYRNFIPDESRKYLEKLFSEFDKDVIIEVYTQKGPHDEYNEFTLNLCRALAILTDKIEISEYSLDSDMARKRGVDTTPTVLISPESYDIRFLGAPAGEEGRALVEALNLASRGTAVISDSTKEIMSKLESERQIKIFSSPTCPYCPGQAINAFKAAVVSPDKVSAWCISTLENSDLAEKYKVGSVPHTDFNNEISFIGLEAEEKFMTQLLFLKPLDDILKNQREIKKETGQKKNETDIDLVIIGSGPAGMSAGIYAKRSGLSCVILDKHGIGGQIALTPKVENYPGFSNIQGIDLVEILSTHAREYTEIKQFVEVLDLQYGERIKVVTDETTYHAKGILLATGVKVRMLDVPGEDKFYGHGVSYCATCDGNFYRGGKVLVIGGGNTAMTDALHLKKLGVETTIVHRGDSFRGEKVLQDAVAREEIEILWNCVVSEVLGEDQVVGARLKNTKDGSEFDRETDGLFVAIGQTPNTVLAEKIGVKLCDDGFIEVDTSQRTNIERVYAAGDVTGGVRQIITATGQGAAAALTAFEDFNRFYADENKIPKNIW
ncbi:thioredoxin reductase (NADPH) [Maridesulfovibrio ferrireducens]|uniref:Thioredoxin reductase (NADPH) n=1 Tax=Maridesulfovibrio ferrireducens TaxID=246191 RepID=A0A1G9CC42_9BACT|nr:FAD-dependent oxidoreductase [Maridesulfovibrio ferrireducens]SDK49258.1 thioredoxin reductase (NADPH) [Maridesulfovibrio ferrireducens]